MTPGDELDRDALTDRDDDLGDELADLAERIELTNRADEAEAFAAIDFAHEQRRL